MPSPFPGMDPYIEASGRWPDFHLNILSALRQALNAVLPERYAAGTEETVWVETANGEAELLGVPDVKVADEGARGNGAAVVTAPAPTAVAPLLLRWPPLRKRTRRFLQIVDLDSHRVVTVIEVLSPSNKTAGPDGRAYRAKRMEYVASRTNLVEIDLLRDGERPPLGKPAPPASDYYLVVSRAAHFPEMEFWPFSVRDPLPPLPVPLDPQTGGVSIDLRSCVDRVYDGGRYHRIDYSRPLAPPLTDPDAAWARELLANRARPVVS